MITFDSIVKLAESLFEQEKSFRLGHDSEFVYPLKSFFVDRDLNVRALVSTPFLPSHLEERDEIALAIRLFSVCAEGIIVISEAWMSDRCAQCGRKDKSKSGDTCEHCGCPQSDPTSNPFREEAMICTAGMRNSSTEVMWGSNILRDAGGKITSYEAFALREKMPAAGRARLQGLFDNEPWMVPHVLSNYRAVHEAWGRTPNPSGLAGADRFLKVFPQSTPVVRLDGQRIRQVFKPVRMKTASCSNG